MKLPSPLIVPYSPEWFNARRGKITASERLHVVVYGTTSQRNAVLDELELELLHPPKRSRSNRYQAWGKANEPVHRAMIEIVRDVDTVEPGFITHPDVPILGGTPDYWVLDAAGNAVVSGEMKCPYYEKWQLQIARCGLRSDTHPDWMQKYYTQVQGQMLLSGTPASWFSTYHPDIEPPGKRLYIEVVEPDLTLHARMLESCSDMADKLQRGVRFGTGVMRNADGVPQVF